MEQPQSLHSSLLPRDAQDQATTLIRNLAEHLSRIANGLPSTSCVSLYLEYTLFLVRKLRSETTPHGLSSGPSGHKNAGNIHPNMVPENETSGLQVGSSKSLIDFGNLGRFEVPTLDQTLPPELWAEYPLDISLPQLAIFDEMRFPFSV